MENSIAIAISNQDWGTVYDLHYLPEWVDHGVTKEKFVKFMTCVTRDIPPEAIKSYTLIELKPNEPGYMDNETHHRVLIEFPKLATYKGTPMRFYTVTAQTQDGWVVPTADLPILFAECVTKNRHDRHAFLYKCMVEADIEFYPVHLNSMSREGLERYLSGQATDDSPVFVKRR